MNKKDREILRELALCTAELAGSEENVQRKRLWTSVKDLSMVRPTVQVEVQSIKDFLREDELLCTEPAMRDIEYRLRRDLKHAAELGDDYVLEGFYNIGVAVNSTGFGVDIIENRISDSSGSIAFTYNHPIDSPDKVSLLQTRTHRVDMEKTHTKKELAEELFGDILPVRVFDSMYVPCLTSELYKLIGNDSMMYWIHDEPDVIHRLMRFIADDKMALFRMLETNGCICDNTEGSFVGSGSPGYMSRSTKPSNTVRMGDVWVWLESQETTMFSPEAFKEFFLPYIAEFGRAFGYVYYGCCERVDDKWQDIISSIPNARAVSVSPWTDVNVLAELVRGDVVLSKKPFPQYISGSNAEWEEVEKEITTVMEVCKRNGCNLEIILRDLYTINGDLNKLKEWVRLTKSVTQG